MNFNDLVFCSIFATSVARWQEHLERSCKVNIELRIIGFSFPNQHFCYVNPLSSLIINSRIAQESQPYGILQAVNFMLLQDKLLYKIKDQGLVINQKLEKPVFFSATKNNDASQ